MDTVVTQHQHTRPFSKTLCTRCEELDLQCIEPGRFTKKLLLMLSAKHLANSKCLRLQIILMLIFTAFPLCGIFITDLTFILIAPDYAIPVLHMVICAILFLAIVSSYILLLLHSIPRSAISIPTVRLRLKKP